ncbi:TIGR01777 family oxidoreductase [uncultured Draconibacterium sp.]|uniref:TIGR01777 family oxidoreductase n=1 Tax=uncultured Draconibacterium sp. TaxID=1573823 RepID=UPI0032165EB8
MTGLKIKITGINGYLGQLISQKLLDNQHLVSGVKRELLYGDPAELQNEIKECDVLINLAGAPILQRWTSKNKQLIYDSRITSTLNLVEAVNQMKPEERPLKFISASAIGIYKSGKIHTEKSTDFDTGFVGKVVLDWEKSLNKLPRTVQQNIFRIGLVLGKNAKTITNLLLPFKLGLGGKIASGNQPFPFIHELDLVNAFVWAVEECSASKTFNLVAPQNINNQDFTKALAKSLHRPAIFPIPEILLKLIFGKAAILLTHGPAVIPEALLENNFEFNFPTIESALSEIIV